MGVHYTYTGKAKFVATNHYRSFSVRAKSEDHAKTLLKTQGYTDPFTITLTPDEPATDKQIEFAKSLGIKIPPDISKSDISNLIDVALKKASFPKQDFFDYAYNNLDLDISLYITKRSLYNAVWSHLTGIDKYAFFCLCVYRWLSEDRRNNLATHPQKDAFYEFAANCVNDPKFIKSLHQSYSNAYTIMFFGKVKYNRYDEDYYEGGSTTTYAYNKAFDFLNSKFGLKKRQTKILSRHQEERQQTTTEANTKFISNFPSKSPAVTLTPSVDTTPPQKSKGAAVTFWTVIIVVAFFLAVVLMLQNKQEDKPTESVTTSQSGKPGTAGHTFQSVHYRGSLVNAILTDSLSSSLRLLHSASIYNFHEPLFFLYQTEKRNSITSSSVLLRSPGDTLLTVDSTFNLSNEVSNVVITLYEANTPAVRRTLTYSLLHFTKRDIELQSGRISTRFTTLLTNNLEKVDVIIYANLIKYLKILLTKTMFDG